MEVLRYQNHEPSILPHHFVDFATYIHGSLKDHPMKIQLSVLSRRLKSGINRLDLPVKVPDGNKAKTLYGDWISYPTDVHGGSPNEVNKKMEAAYNNFFIGNQNEMVSISLFPDGVCNSCAFGAHCHNNFEQRKKGRSEDNLFMERFVAWQQLSLSLNHGLPLKTLANVDPNLGSWFVKISRFRDLFANDAVSIISNDSGHVYKISMQRQLLTDNISMIAYFMNPPEALLLWVDRDNNLLAKNKDKIIPLIGILTYKEFLDIVSTIQKIDSKNI